jgi:acetate kinase
VELAAIDSIAELLGDAQCQVAVFDTGFHATLPPAAYTYAGPYEWSTSGLRRYGFHGISHQYASARAAHLLGQDLHAARIVTVHLGGGASVAAVHNGVSVDTSMGFTPMDGLVMATRAGAIDPGLLLHVLRRGTYSVEALDHLLNHESGIKGLSGLSDDMQTVVAAAHAGNERAQLAVDVYVHHAQQHIAAMAASMNGLDALVFTAGVGEHAADIREAICAQLSFLGIDLSEAANHMAILNDRIVSSTTSRVPVLVIHAEENWMMAQECRRLLEAEAPTP